MSEGFVKLQRSGTTIDLLSDPLAMHLLTVIALRARYSDEPNLHGLAFGSALIGDCTSYGMTRGQERSARRRLEKYGLASFKTSRSGTTANLLNARVFSLRDERKPPKGDHHKSHQNPELEIQFGAENSANKQPTDSQRMTTNKKESRKELKNTIQTPTASLETIEIPETLKTTEFLSAWNRWEGVRRKGRKPPGGWNRMFGDQLRWLEKLGAETALGSLEQTLRNGWQSLYEPKAAAIKRVQTNKSQFVGAF